MLSIPIVYVSFSKTLPVYLRFLLFIDTALWLFWFSIYNMSVLSFLCLLLTFPIHVKNNSFTWTYSILPIYITLNCHQAPQTVNTFIQHMLNIFPFGLFRFQPLECELFTRHLSASWRILLLFIWKDSEFISKHPPWVKYTPSRVPVWVHLTTVLEKIIHLTIISLRYIPSKQQTN